MSKRPPFIRYVGEALKARAITCGSCKKGDRDACTDPGKGRRSERGADPPDPGGHGRVPEVQPGAGQGGGGNRRWPTLPERPGQTRSVRRQEAHRHRRAIRGEEGAGGRVWVVVGAVE